MTNRKETIDDLIKASEKIGDYDIDERPITRRQTQSQESRPNYIKSNKWKRWTADEDDIIIREINNNKNNFAARAAEQLEGRDAESIKAYWFKVLKKKHPNTSVRSYGQWTAAEDDIIIREMNNNKDKFAARASDQLEGRDANVIMNRWNNVLRYNTDKFGLLPKDYTPEQRKQHIEIYGKTVKYTPEERKQAIERWKKKHEIGNASNVTRYKHLQERANASRRVKGRFVAKDPSKGGKTKKRTWSLKYKRSINCKRKNKKHLTRRKK